ncbi:MAG: subclass B3 metallo-beta-lactamase [Pseudomonadota bacterium]
MRILLISAFLMAASLVTAKAADDVWQAPFNYAKAFPKMAAPFEPFRIIGEIYYVGMEGLPVYLIAREDGHVLIDGGLPGYEGIIFDNIEKLGFDIIDVEYLLNTHAHFDHSGGLAKLKAVSGAKLIASEGDVSALEGGFYLGFEGARNFSSPPVKVDEQIADRSPDYERWTIAGVNALSANLTPGHSRGCISWRLTVEEAGEEFDVLIFCSATVAANSLVPEQYEGIVDDYRLTFEKTKNWDPDVFLANHSEVFHMKETRERQKAGDALAFVNRGAFQKYITAKESAFKKALQQQADKARDDK